MIHGCSRSYAFHIEPTVTVERGVVPCDALSLAAGPSVSCPAFRVATQLRHLHLPPEDEEAGVLQASSLL